MGWKWESYPLNRRVIGRKSRATWVVRFINFREEVETVGVQGLGIWRRKIPWI